MKARKWILAKHFEGVPKDSDLELVEEELPSLKDGEVLFEAEYLSVDPYMRPYSRALSPGSVMYGEQLARVIESKNEKYALGAHYLVRAGWRDRIVIDPDTPGGALGVSSVLSAIDTGSHPASLNIGILGMPGISAYIGLIKICDPKPGETVYVNSAAGIVGSVVGQIAKIKGCKVIGSAGTDEKCKWLTTELGFDYAFNYKTRDLNEALKESAPNGVDCFFDNVGDSLSTAIIVQHMNKYGRISCCGAISQYNDTTPPTGQLLYSPFVFKELKMQGFLFPSYAKHHQAMLVDLRKWVIEGKLKYHEDVVEGFENMREAFYGMLSGKYTGKVVVKATQATKLPAAL